MQSDLQDLLRRCSVAHPTRIVAVDVHDRRLQITVEGYPWWRNEKADQHEQILLSFENVQEGTLTAEITMDMLAGDEEALEFFSVSSLPDEPWAFGNEAMSTYCSEPLPEPLRLFALVEDYLWEAGALRTARDFLHIPNGSLAEFCDLTRANLYLVANAPQHIHELIVSELRRQNVAHHVLTDVSHPEEGLIVRIGSTAFICHGAMAEA